MRQVQGGGGDAQYGYGAHGSCCLPFQPGAERMTAALGQRHKRGASSVACRRRYFRQLPRIKAPTETLR